MGLSRIKCIGTVAYCSSYKDLYGKKRNNKFIFSVAFVFRLSVWFKNQPRSQVLSPTRPYGAKD